MARYLPFQCLCLSVWWQLLLCDEVVASCCPHPGPAQLSLCHAAAKLPGLSSCAWLAGVITSSQPELTVSHNPSSLVPIPGRHSLWSEELESGGPFQNCNGSLREGEQAGNGELSPGPSEPDSKSRSHKSLEWLFSLELGHVILESLVITCRTWVTCH